jgi:hypothetical protein
MSFFSTRPLGEMIPNASDSSPGRVSDPSIAAWKSRSHSFIREIGPASVFVGVVLLILTIVHLRFVLQHSYPIPYWDESGFIPYVTGDQQIDLAWLWKPANEHRIPLIRVLYVFIARISRIDARAMNATNVGLLAITSGVLLFALRKANGKTQYTDAIIPLALLSLGQYPNTTWPNQLAFVVPTCVACLSAMLFALPGREDRRLYLLLGPAVLVMCLCGANGLPIGLALSPILLWVALLLWRAGRRRDAAFAIACEAITLIYSAFYFVGLRKITFANTRPFSFGEGLAEGLKAAAQCFGPSGVDIWPYSGVLAIVLLTAGMSILCYHFARIRSSRFAAAGLALALIGFAGLALGIGMGRTVLGPGAGFAPRYALLVSPIPLVVMFAFDRFGTPQFRDFVRMTIFTILCLAYWPNGRVSISDLENRIADGHNLEMQVQLGTPIAKLAEDFGSRWMFTPDNFAEKMQMLAKARMGIYRVYPPPSESAELLGELSANTEVKGPLTSGRLFRLGDFKIPGTIGLIAHPSHRCSMAIPPQVRRLHLGFGILPDNRTDGVEFRVSVRKRDGTVLTFWSRRLDPVHSSGDTGVQQADIDLPKSTESSDRLVFETIAIKDPFGCWAFWTDLGLR